MSCTFGHVLLLMNTLLSHKKRKKQIISCTVEYYIVCYITENATLLLPLICQMLTDFYSSFINRLSTQFLANS